MGNVWTTMPKKQDILFGINHDNIVTEITKKNWQTTAVCHVDHIGVIYAYITKYIGREYVHIINTLETGYCIMKTNINTATHNQIIAKIKIPFVGFANELVS